MIIVDINMLQINNCFGLEKLFVRFSMIIVDISMLQINNCFGLEKLFVGFFIIIVDLNMLQINNGVGLVFVNLGHKLNRILEESFLRTLQLHLQLHIF